MSELTRLVDRVEKSTDSWGHRYVNGTSTLSNLNSTYGYSPERFRLWYDQGTITWTNTAEEEW
jgi:hypothetical protein